MAIENLSTTRRGALAAIAGSAALAAPGTAALAAIAFGEDRSAWDAAMVRFHRADAEAKGAIARWERARETYEGVTGQSALVGRDKLDQSAAQLSGFTQAEHTIDAFTDKQSAAWSALIRTPAPDRKALFWKLNELYGPNHRDEGGFADGWCGEIVDALLADAKRLLADA